ncbi:malonyl-[acyl-carrier protein] O-methyltransferase [mine drainage metagenome]|uniref:Malonyl-[acyl-carrier protein] O-methyltransferase n=1 Tax=mine drainage metagenome TaxID=410659 RepID=A0A1J5TCF8_9ZZZZ
MSQLSARFFNYVQGAEFYRDLHQQAVSLLPPGSGSLWFDVGCGPGLVTRLAAEHGYQATGFDMDPTMIVQAKKNSSDELSISHYEVISIDELQTLGGKANVVSAASLLFVLNDKERALHQLLSCLVDGGILLVIETTDLMKPRNAWAWLLQNGFGNRNWILLLWAWTRANGRSVTPTDMNISDHRIERTDLLEGLVSAWLLSKC